MSKSSPRDRAAGGAAPQTITVQITRWEGQQVALGVERYCAKLADEASGLEKLRRSEAERVRGDAEALVEELCERFRAVPSDMKNHPIEVHPRHVVPIMTGLDLLARGMRAAKGTLKPLGMEDWIGDLDSWADHISGSLRQQFDPQGTLFPEQQPDLELVGEEE